MSKVLPDKPTDTIDRGVTSGVVPGATLAGVPARRASKRRRIILMAGGAVAMLVAAGIVTLVALPFAAPRAPAIPETRSFVQSGLPEGRAVQPGASAAVASVPPVSHDVGFHERVAALEAASSTTAGSAQPAYVNWPETRTDRAVDQAALPSMRPVPGAVDGRGGEVRSTESAAIPSMPTGMGSWDATAPNNPTDVAPSSSADLETSQTSSPKTPAATDQPLEIYRYAGVSTPVPASSPTWDPACGAPSGGDPGCLAG
jgi:hypothetical protein